MPGTAVITARAYARGGTRTRKPDWAMPFECIVYANSTTRAGVRRLASSSGRAGASGRRGLGPPTAVVLPAALVLFLVLLDLDVPLLLEADHRGDDEDDLDDHDQDRHRTE